MKRRFFLTGALSTAALPACANAPDTSTRPSVRPAGGAVAAAGPAEGMIAEKGLTDRVAFVVADARTGEVLESVNPIRPQPPASTLKTVTALYALETLGADHRFQTTVIATGPVQGGRVAGDLVLVGGGDPALDTDGLDDLARQVRAAGITSVGGSLLVSSGRLPIFERIDRSQPEHVGYNPAVGGMNVNFNRVHFAWARSGAGYATKMEARTERFAPLVDSSRMSVADRSLPVYTYARQGDVDAWTVARGQLGGSGSRWLPVRNPLHYAGDIFAGRLAAQGVTAGAPRVTSGIPQGQVVARGQSAELSRIVRTMLRYSTNITAEVLGMSSTAARGGGMRSLSDSGRAMSGWLAARAGTRRADFDDHSGLNGSDRISPAEMVRMLTAQGAEARLRPVLRDYSVGESNPVDTRAKTGTLNFVSCLTGYCDARSGRRLAFATFCADLDRRNGLSVGQRERPEGGSAWNRRARSLQFDLIERWARLYT